MAVAGKPGAELLLGMFVGMLFAEVQVDDLLDRFLRVGAHKYSRSDMLEYLFELFFEIVLRNGYCRTERTTVMIIIQSKSCFIQK